MKKSILTLLIISTLAYSHAASSCLDFSANLTRGSESSTVLQLQNFLYTKGVLKATPNGYFGPATFAAVQAYQKSIGLPQVGNTGPATRAAIKKESCSVTNNTVSPQSNTVVNQNTASTVSQLAPTSSNLPRPVITSVDLVTLFAGGSTDWGFSMYGSGFSTSSNVVSMRNIATQRTYAIGTFTSASGTIAMPKNLTGTVYSCGYGCQEKLPAGQYEVTVTTQGGSSEPRTLTIKPFTLTAIPTSQATLPYKSTGTKVGVVSFGAAQPVIVRNITFNITDSSITPGGVSVSFKNEATGAAYALNGELSAFDSVTLGLYADTNNTKSGTVTGTFSVTVEDYIGKKSTTFTSSPILFTVAGAI